MRTALIFVTVAACGASEPATTPRPPILLKVLSANVGNLDEVTGGPCPARPYRGALCSRALERQIRARIDAEAPDVVALMEVLDADLCATATSTNPDFICTDAATRIPYHSVQRMVGPDFTIVCDAIAHYDCLAVRTSRIAIEACAAGEVCMGGAETPDHPPECATNGSITSVSGVRAKLDGRPLNIVLAHPLNAVSVDDDRCRFAQYRQAFSELPSDGATLIAGDMNNDPYRDDFFESGRYWHSKVGAGQRFGAHSVTESPPVPTWGGALTLDYVLSDFADGTCRVLDGTDRIDGVLGRTDHRALVCNLSWP